MLTIESVNPTGMFSFSDCQDIDLQAKGMVNLLGVNRDKQGDSNGSGKSSVFNAICEIHYQENPTRVSGDSVINTVWGQGFSGRTVFTAWEGIKYRITYCRKQKAQVYASDNDTRAEYTGTSLFLDKLVAGSWVDCRGASMKETQVRIQNALGLTYNQFVAVAYMTPRQGNVLLRGANKDRMDVLSGLVGLDVWDSLLDAIRRKKLELDRGNAALEKQVAYLEGELSQLQAQAQNRSLDTVLADIKDAEAQIKTVCDLRAASEARLNDLRSQSDTLLAERAEMWERLELGNQGQKNDIQAQITDLRVERSACRTSINPELATEFNEAETKLNVARGTLAAVKGNNNLVDVANCPTCGTKITKTARTQMEKSIGEAETAVEQCEAKTQAIRESVEADKLKQENEINTKQREIDRRIKTLETKYSQAASLQANNMIEYNKLEPRVTGLQVQINQVQAHVTECDRAETNWKTRVEELNKAVAEIQGLTTLVEAKQAEYTAKSEAQTATVQDIAHYTWFITNIPYIKLHKLAVALADLSDLANGYLQKMGDTANISISSFKEKKKATSELKIDQLKGEISVTIVDGQKDIDPRLYSDGETARFSTALVRAIHDLAVKHGQGCNLVLLDEVFSFVDGNNCQRIADSFAQDLQAGSTYIVTDNSGAAADIMDFDHVWTVTKENGLSQLTHEE